ncbi:response regulator [Brenneria sp. g21c3]|uniref:response regulator n=1 Tax=Brenneria sp. g21c3 TaxID=3093893 RepID=UPI002ECEABEF|nr:response regulator [Brenneria sp. g21c3]
MQAELIDVMIVEDESQLSQLYAELIDNHPWLRLVGGASTLREARELIQAKRPQLLLLDNYLPDGQGISLMESDLIKKMNCSVIFITAASDMDTCSQAIRCGAFDYILKPISWTRLKHSLERFIQFNQTQRSWKVVDQQNVDSLYQLQSKDFMPKAGNKGIEENTLLLIEEIFAQDAARCYSVDEIADKTGLSKTTVRRYLEHGVQSGRLRVEMLYGKIGHPRRMYRRV